jgi:hypothetical protein
VALGAQPAHEAAAHQAGAEEGDHHGDSSGHDRLDDTPSGPPATTLQARRASADKAFQPAPPAAARYILHPPEAWAASAARTRAGPKGSAMNPPSLQPRHSPRALPAGLALAVAASLLSMGGCATSTAQMTPQQREGVELRRYCERNKNDPERCLGFYGWV